ncbi:Uncharacterised protein [Salmonella enterica subsp. enterica]|uniref:Uncharacterized protein n=1 Tax=Salmonella enterica I TaxID=59201 RepID=A0A379WRR2_SALET|nr:Uncharacterised protein [Salmonella enterica subsp. enterica]
MLPMVWLMSKHSIRLIAGSFNTAASAVKRCVMVDCCESLVIKAVAALVPRQLEITGAIAARFCLNMNTPSGKFRQRVGQQRFIAKD